MPDPERVAPQLGPDARERRLLELLRRLTLARSRREPAVVIFEDLHWIDAATERFLAMLVDAAEDTRTLMLVNFRPEYRAEWMSRRLYQQLPLRPLDADALAELLVAWLGNDPSLGGLAEHILERTAGNPFFTEEVVRSLIGSDVLVGTSGAYRLTEPILDLQIPDSVHSLLAARIDRLGDEEKQLLQAASAVGDEVAEPLLSGLSSLEGDAFEAAIRALIQAELLYESALFPERELSFRHP